MNGSLYTSSGLYTFNYLNYNGCDSIHTLDLRINICGCTDSLAYNYNPNANSDDGSCVDIVLGCIDSSQFNYDPLANTDDGSCVPFIYGCIDSTQFNFNPFANTDDGSCIPFIYGCTDSTQFNYNSLANTSDGSCIPFIYGCIDSLACNFLPGANTDDGSCNLIFGCLDQLACNYDSLANCHDSSLCQYFTYNYVNLSACGELVYDGNIYDSSGVYNIVSSSNSQGSSSLNYCASAPGTNSYSTIDLVSILGDKSSISNNTVGQCDMYEDYTSQEVILSPGSSYSLTVNLGTCNPGQYNVDSAGVFIDWNQDGDFDDLYEKISSFSGLQSPTSNSITINVPLNAHVGTTRMRIVSNAQINNQFFPDNPISPCIVGDFGQLGTYKQPWYGATEDYTIRIGSNSCEITVLTVNIFNSDSSFNIQNICQGDTVQVGSSVYTSSGTFIDIQQTVNGCDSIVTTEISVLPAGCTDSTAFNFNPLVNCDDGSCIPFVYGCTDSTQFNYSLSANTDDGSCVPYVYGCTDSTQFNYTPHANTDDGSCVPYIYGCTDSTQFNYDPLSNTDDGSCIAYYYGCTDSLALNFDSLANTDDGSCCGASISLPPFGIQIGNDIDGNPGSGSGRVVSQNSHGTIVAIGNGNGSGDVKIYKILNGSWIQIGQTIIGGSNVSSSHPISISLNSDGNVIAIGDPNNNVNGVNSGQVRIYQFGNTWTQLGLYIDGIYASYFGCSVSLNNDGRKIAIGAKEYNSYNEEGFVNVFEFNDTSWVQLGQTIVGEGYGDYSGSAVSLSGDGKILAVGAPGNDGAQSNHQANQTYGYGHVRVFEYSGSLWSQIGQDIDANSPINNAGDNLGTSVALSNNGSRIAIGAPGNDANGLNSGHTKIFNYSNNAWIQLGEDIVGEGIGDLSGSTVSINHNGDRVSIGAIKNNGNGNHSGHVRIYDYNGISWVQYGQDLDGEAAGDESGPNSLSSDGNIIVIGAWGNDANGNMSGNARIYSLGGTGTQANRVLDVQIHWL